MGEHTILKLAEGEHRQRYRRGGDDTVKITAKQWSHRRPSFSGAGMSLRTVIDLAAWLASTTKGCDGHGHDKGTTVSSKTTDMDPGGSGR